MCFLQLSDLAYMGDVANTSHVYQEVGKVFCGHMCDVHVHMTFTKTLPSFLITY